MVVERDRSQWTEEILKKMSQSPDLRPIWNHRFWGENGIRLYAMFPVIILRLHVFHVFHFIRKLRSERRSDLLKVI